MAEDVLREIFEGAAGVNSTHVTERLVTGSILNPCGSIRRRSHDDPMVDILMWMRYTLMHENDHCHS